MNHVSNASRIALFFRTLFGKDTTSVKSETPAPSEIRYSSKKVAAEHARVVTSDPASHLLYHLYTLGEDLRLIKQRGESHDQRQLLCDHRGLTELVRKELFRSGELHIPTVIRIEQAGYHVAYLRQQEEVLLCTPYGNLVVPLVEDHANAVKPSESFESPAREIRSRVSKSNPKTVRSNHDIKVAHSAQ